MLSNRTLLIYLIKTYMKIFITIFSVVTLTLSLANIVDVVSNLKSNNIAAGILLKIAFFKVPYLMQEALAILVFITSLLFFQKLSKEHILIIVRNMGISVWGTLLPAIISAFFIGVFWVLVWNPLASILLFKVEKLEAKYLGKRTSVVSLLKTGIMIKEKEPNSKNTRFIRAGNIDSKKENFTYISLFVVDPEYKLLKRVDARSATVNGRRWKFRDAGVWQHNKKRTYHKQYNMDSKLSMKRLVGSFTPPDSMPVLELPSFINNLEESGLSSREYKKYFYKSLFKPLLLITMTLIASCFVSISPRFGHNSMMLLSGIATGFLVNFIIGIFAAVLLSWAIAPILAELSPIIITILASNFAILHYQDR